MIAIISLLLLCTLSVMGKCTFSADCPSSDIAKLFIYQKYIEAALTGYYKHHSKIYTPRITSAEDISPDGQNDALPNLRNSIEDIGVHLRRFWDTTRTANGTRKHIIGDLQDPKPDFRHGHAHRGISIKFRQSFVDIAAEASLGYPFQQYEDGRSLFEHLVSQEFEVDMGLFKRMPDYLGDFYYDVVGGGSGSGAKPKGFLRGRFTDSSLKITEPQERNLELSKSGLNMTLTNFNLLFNTDFSLCWSRWTCRTWKVVTRFTNVSTKALINAKFENNTLIKKLNWQTFEAQTAKVHLANANLEGAESIFERQLHRIIEPQLKRIIMSKLGDQFKMSFRMTDLKSRIRNLFEAIDDKVEHLNNKRLGLKGVTFRKPGIYFNREVFMLWTNMRLETTYTPLPFDQLDFSLPGEKETLTTNKPRGRFWRKSKEEETSSKEEEKSKKEKIGWWQRLKNWLSKWKTKKH